MQESMNELRNYSIQRNSIFPERASCPNRVGLGLSNRKLEKNIKR